MDDLAACSDAQAAAETLRARQAAELIFTRLGTQLVALTPARPLPALFSRAELQRYRTLERLLPPRGRCRSRAAHAGVGVRPRPGSQVACAAAGPARPSRGGGTWLGLGLGLGLGRR